MGKGNHAKQSFARMRSQAELGNEAKNEPRGYLGTQFWPCLHVCVVTHGETLLRLAVRFKGRKSVAPRVPTQERGNEGLRFFAK